MLRINDYNHLKLLYEKFSKMNAYIKDLINKGDWDGVDFAVQDKNSLLRQIILFEKPHIKEIKTNEELNALRLHLIELEKENIELVKEMKEKLLSQIGSVKKAKRILNAYEPVDTTVSTFEISDDV